MSGTTTRMGSSRLHVLVPCLGAAGTALACALTFGTPLPAVAATFYVDNTNPGCSNAGPGSATIPYCAISSAATQHPGAGNTIMVVAGTYREQVSVPASGASGSPFVIQAASPSVTVDGADDFTGAAQWTLVSGNVWLAASVTWSPKQVFADGARLTGSTVAPASMPARTFQYVAGSGLYVNAGGGSPAGHGALVGHRLYGFTMSGRSWVSIRGFSVTHAEDKGIQVQSASNQCEITDNRTSLNFKFGIQVAGSNGCRVARNVSSDNGGHGIGLTAGSTGCTVEDNESYGNADPVVRVANGLYLFGAPANVIQRNRYHDNQDSGQHIQSSSNDCVSLQNRSWNNGDHGFDHLGTSGTLHVGDVAWGNYMDGFSIEGNAPGTRLFNCIATDNGLTTNEFDLWLDQTSTVGFVSDYNLFWNSTGQPPVKYITTQYTSVAAYSAASGQDAQTVQDDPQFVNPGAGDFHLGPGSPAIDNASSAVASWPATDANGLARLDDPASPNAGVGPVLFADRGALEFPPTVLTLLPASGVAPLTVTADATGSLGPDGTAASYRFDFGDGAVVGPQPGPTATHTYAAGEWTATVTVTDRSGSTGTATASVVVSASNNGPVNLRIVLASDDAEEASNGKSVVSNNDLDLVYDKSNQTVGLRWTSVAIPRYAFIDAAYIQFTAKDSRSEATSLTIRGQAADNPATFTTANNNISARTRTAASAGWTPAAWTKDQAGASQRTSDLSALVQEIVNRPGWASGNALAIIVTGTGHRTAYAFDASASKAPLLHVEYRPDFPPAARISVLQLATPALTVIADASTSTDDDPSPIASYRFDFGDGSPAATTLVPTATAQHTYAAPGIYTVTLTATDTRGLQSTAVTTSVTVNGPPTARLSVRQGLTPPLTVTADASASTDPDPMPIASYRFDFGDGSAAITTTVPTAIAQHAYAAAGPYTVTLTVTDRGGLTSAPVTASITVDAAPTARLSVSQLPAPPLTVSANGSASTDTDATPIASYRFDFGDGSPAVTTTAPAAATQHTYAAPGTYTVTLTATDTGGLTSAPATASIQVDSPPTARLAVAPVASPPLTVNADGSASTDTDATPIASYRFDFGDGSPAVTTTAPTAAAQHTYAAAGTYTVTLNATDTGGFTSAPATASVTVVGTLDRRIATSSDDAEESASGKSTVGNNDLELVYDRSNQTVGMRWSALPIPPRAIISAAYIQFSARESQSEATSLTIRGQAADNAPTFTTGNGNVSARPRTAASAGWAPAAWTAGQAGSGQRTPDLRAVLQEIVNRPGWASGNALAIIVTGTGHRTAWSYDGSSAAAPLLHVEFTSQETAPTARLSVAQLASPPLTVLANGSASTAGSAPIASYRFNFGDGSPQVTTTAPTVTAQHAYAAAGTYTVTLVATDAGGLTSAPASASIAVSAGGTDNPPVARLAVTQAANPPLTVSADASSSTDTDATPIASYRFNFGDGTAQVTTTAPTATAQHTYAAAGSYTVTLLVTDSGGLTSAPATASVAVVTSSGATLERRIAAWQDDSEEAAGGTIYVNSSDLELVTDGSTTQTVGMRWSGMTIPQGASITAAWIQFGAKESQSEATNLTIRAEAADDAAVLGSSTGNLSTRPRTTAAALWAPVAWVAGEAGANQRTPDLKAVIQEIVNRPGWASGHALAIIVTGTGHRTAWAYDGNAAAAPLLHVEYTTGASAQAMRTAPEAAAEGALDALPDTRPRILALSSAYPNPVASQVSFRLEVPEPASIRFAIFDVQGRAVWSEERMFEAGRTVLSWSGRTADGSHAGSGLYFARVQASGRVLVRRFVRL